MIIRSIEGNDNISRVMNQAMGATVNALYQEKLLTREQANNFLDTHACLMVNEDGPWARIKKFLNWKQEEGMMYSLVVKICQVPEEVKE
jgi:hypothetical protein